MRCYLEGTAACHSRPAYVYRHTDYTGPRMSTACQICLALRKPKMASKYSKGAQRKVEKVMKERKRGTLKSGRSGKTVKSRKQAIAIGLSEARRAGKKVPEKTTT
jgi:hypothetical protein